MTETKKTTATKTAAKKAAPAKKATAEKATNTTVKAAPKAAAAKAPVASAKLSGAIYATGKRKDSVARVYLTPGKGNITINGEETEIIVPVMRGTLDLSTGALTVGEVSEE